MSVGRLAAMPAFEGLAMATRRRRNPCWPVRDTDDLTTITRTARVVAAFMQGEGLTVGQLMALTGLTRQGVHYVLDALTAELHLYCRRKADGEEVYMLLGSDSGD